jgi:predicted secreted protein
MQWTSALAIYFIFWFFCLFLVLPFHARRAGEDAVKVPGQEDGAPAHFAIGRAAAQVSIVAAILFALYYANYVSGWITAEDLNLFGRPQPS